MAEYAGVSKHSHPHGEADTPKCRVHQVFMVYRAMDDSMYCPERDCSIKAWRKKTYEDALGVKVDGQPLAYRGRIQFVADEEGSLFLHLVSAGIVVDIMGIQEATPLQLDALKHIQLSLMTNAASIAKHLPEVSEKLKKRRQLDTELADIDKRTKSRYAEIQPMENKESLRAHLFGVPLPPHIGSEQADRIAAAVPMVDELVRGLERTNRVAAYIEYVFPTRISNILTSIEIFTESGKLVSCHSFGTTDYEVFYKNVEDLLRAAEESCSVPCYTMLNGHMYSFSQWKHLFAEARARHLVGAKKKFLLKKDHGPDKLPTLQWVTDYL